MTFAIAFEEPRYAADRFTEAQKLQAALQAQATIRQEEERTERRRIEGSSRAAEAEARLQRDLQVQRERNEGALQRQRLANQGRLEAEELRKESRLAQIRERAAAGSGRARGTIISASSSSRTSTTCMKRSAA